MCIESEIRELSSRISTIETVKYPMEELDIINTKLDRISAFLFGTERDKSNVVVKS